MYKRQYTWSTTGNPGVFDNANSINPKITPAPLGKSTYKITAKYPSCPIDSTAEFDITVEPVPTVKVDNDAAMCENDTMLLHGVISVSYTHLDVYKRQLVFSKHYNEQVEWCASGRWCKW